MAGKGNIQIKEIAEKLGLSAGTVSIVLNGRGDKMRISKETQKKIKDIAKEMGYQPNIYARRLRNAGVEGTGRVIAVFWNSGYADEIMGSFFRGLQRTAEETEEHVEFYIHMFAYGQLVDCEQMMTPSRYSGIIVCGISDADAEFLNTHTFEIPIVCVFRNEKNYPCVYVDDYAVGSDCAALFAKRGHKSAGFIGSSQNGPNSVLRQMGFINKCRELGIEVKKDWIREEDERDFHSGHRAMDSILKCEENPTAVLVNVPDQAIGAVVACRNNGMQFQKDIEVLAAGSSKVFEYFSPSISTVCTPVELVAENTLNLLLLIIEKDIWMPMSRVLDAEYVFGDTCQSPEKTR